MGDKTLGEFSKQSEELVNDFIGKVWEIVKHSSKKETAPVKTVENRRGWKTIRIFVSSTFRDMYHEREALVKEVFADLRIWCEERKLLLVECDLRWGVPKDTSCEDTIKICLGELDRCREDNVEPFFLNLCGERVGWVPEIGLISDYVAGFYGWIWGLSVTEMEIIHGAFRTLNPKALFMIRTTEGFDEIPDGEKAGYSDTSVYYQEKLKKLISNIKERFPVNHKYYHVKRKCNEEGIVTFDGLSGTDTVFYQTVYNFFKDSIEKQYPLDPRPEDPIQAQKHAHEAFLDNKSNRVLGRDDMIKEIEAYYTTANPSPHPLVVAAESGAGKSSLLAKCAENAEKIVDNGLIEVPSGFDRWKVFYHFVGAVPGSTDLIMFLKRLVKELKPDSKENAKDLDSLTLLTKNILSREDTPPCVLFIDAINQLDEEHQQYLSRWLPEKLSPTIRVIVSTIEGSASHQILKLYEPQPKEILCGPLDDKSKAEIVTDILSAYNKKMDARQMAALIGKSGAANPLWLTLACEEIRVHGTFESIDETIDDLPEELIALEKEVMARYESESCGDLMKATLCLIEVSRHGLLETELLALLGKMRNPGNTGHCCLRHLLPAREWAVVYRKLKPLLRPCGDLGEGRLDFYHRSFSKAVRSKYFSDKATYNYYHGLLADYFEHVTVVERKAEELPFHLEQLGEADRLRKCLLEWPIYNQLYNEDHSFDLIRYWQKCGGFGDAAKSYNESLLSLKSFGVPTTEFCDQQEKVAFFLVQTGQYAESFRMMKECVAIELDEFNGSRLVNLGDLYGAMALCQSQFVNLRQKDMTKEEHVQGRQQVVEFCKKANGYRLKSGIPEQEYKVAVTNDLLCFQLTRIALVEDNKNDPAYQKEASDVINEAIAIFTKFNDYGEVARCIQTAQPIKPFTKENYEEQKAGYLKARDMCLKAYGENHRLFGTVTINSGDFFNNHGMYEEAYENYALCEKSRMNIMGPDHPYTLDIQRIMRQKQFDAIREREASKTI